MGLSKTTELILTGDIIIPARSRPPGLAEEPGAAEAGMRRLNTPEDVARRVKAICAFVPASIVVLDPSLRIIGASASWLAWLGHSADAVIGRDITSFLDQPTRSLLHERPALAPRGSTGDAQRHWGFLSRTGEAAKATVSLSACSDETGRLVFTTCVAVAHPPAVEDANARRLIELSPVPTILRQFDDLLISHANPAFYALTGYPAGKLAGCDVNETGIWESRTQRLRMEHELALSGTIKPQDVTIVTATGERLTCLVSAGLVEIDGKRRGVFMFQDVTERRRDEAQLFEAIQAVMQDSTWFSRSVLEKLATLRSPGKPAGRNAELADLTRREREVLTMISVGQTDLEIARKLGLTRSTVRNHVATLYSKIDVHSRSAAIVWARERGINLAADRAEPRRNGHALHAGAAHQQPGRYPG